MAALAIRLHRQATKESGEAFRNRPIVITWCIGAPVAAGVIFKFGIGAGLAISWVSARVVRLLLIDDTDFSPGIYGRAGLAFQHDSGGMIGIDFHYLGATSVNFAGQGTDIDGWIASIMFGYGF